MSRLMEPRETERRDGVLWSFGISREALAIYQGGLTCLNAAGGAVAGEDSKGYVFIGVAYETKRTAVEDAEDRMREIRVFRKGVFLFDCARDLRIEDHIGDDVFVVDDHTVTNDFHDSEHGVHCGRIVAIETKRTCWIDIVFSC